MSAVDKILHEAISKHFAKLAKDESLDDLVDISLSKAYSIAQHARLRTGKGGKKKKRPVLSGSRLNIQQKSCVFRNESAAQTGIKSATDSGMKSAT
jgi:hypothetical protein